MDEISNLIKQSQSITTMQDFTDWLESVASWLEIEFPNSGYTAEWLGLDKGLLESDRNGNCGGFQNQMEAVDGRVHWLKKLDRILQPAVDKHNVEPYTDSSAIIHDGLLLFKVKSAMQADEALTTWIESVYQWLVENQVESASLANWCTMGKSPFRWSDGILDIPRTWEQYWNIVSKRFRWLADFMSRSLTIENQYRRLNEIEPLECSIKINFEGPGYELIAMLKEALQQEGGRTRFRLFVDDEDIYEYAAFKFLVRGKEMSIRQLKKSVENKQYL